MGLARMEVGSPGGNQGRNPKEEHWVGLRKSVGRSGASRNVNGSQDRALRPEKRDGGGLNRN